MINTSKPVLMIVEDDEGLQRQLRWAYEDYEVIVAGDRASAIDLLRLHEPSVVTLDLGLPPDPDGTTRYQSNRCLGAWRTRKCHARNC
jgi:two-component system, NtrC family, response regulator